MGDVPVSTVLVVDDDELLLRSYKRFWSRFFRVVTATTPHEALELADREQPKLAIIDVYLKCNSGLDLARELKLRHPGLRIALISANATLDLAFLAGRSGADAILAKPISIAEILRRLGEDTPCDVDPARPATLARVEWEHMQRVLADCEGNVSEAARRLDVFRSTLQRKLKRPAPRE